MPFLRGVLIVSGAQTYDPALAIGRVSRQQWVTGALPSIQSSSSTLAAMIDRTTVREFPLTGCAWTSLATLEPVVLSVRSQAITGLAKTKVIAVWATKS